MRHILVLLLFTSLSVHLPMGLNPAQAAEKPDYYEQVYLSEAQAIKQIMGGLKVEKRMVSLDANAKKAIQKKLRRKIAESQIPVWVGLNGSKAERYAFILDEMGKHYPITFIVGISAQSKVTQVAVMVYRERRGDAVKRKRFLDQFVNKNDKDPIEINSDIIHLTGSTISSWSIAIGVRKALAVLQEAVLK